MEAASRPSGAAGPAYVPAGTSCGAPVGSARCPTRRRRQARPILRLPLFDPRPLMGDPVLDRVLVAFFGLALGALHAPAQPVAQQPPHRRIRQRHPVSPWITTATRSRVHTAVANPWASAPASNACSIPSSCSSATLGWRPVGPRLCNPVAPEACQPACQRLALWRETSSSRATSAWVRPWANSSAARSRRAWRSPPLAGAPLACLLLAAVGRHGQI